MSSRALLKECAAVYDSLAPEYDRARFGDRAGHYELEESRALVKHILSALLAGRSSDWLALDVACGTGKAAIAVAQLGGKVVGLDAAPAMLQRCAENARAASVQDRLTLINASADAIPYRDDSFDFVLCLRFLHLFPVSAYAEFLQEMARVVKVGGYVVAGVKNETFWKLLARINAVFPVGPKPSSTSCASLPFLADLASQVGGIKLQETFGLRLPGAWRFVQGGYLARISRMLARGPLKSASPHLIAIYQKV